MRIGLLGGSFDPPHYGHLAVARAALKQAALDRLLLVPTGRQPWKHTADASFADRLAMTELLCREGPMALDASDIDAPRPDGGPNYTVLMLEAVRGLWPEAKLFMIVGADSFADLPKWHEAERMLEMAEWIVVSRPGISVASTVATSDRVHWVDEVNMPLASRALRIRLQQGEACEDALPASVLGYIRLRGLYGTRATGLVREPDPDAN